MVELQYFTAAADPTDWYGRWVYISANDTVSLNNAATQAVLGLVQKVIVDGTTYKVGVQLDGIGWAVNGETALDADAVGVLQYVRGGDDGGGAALDGRSVVGAAGAFVGGRLLARTNIVAGGLVRVVIDPHQLSVTDT